MERVRLRVNVCSLTEYTHVVLSTAVDRWTGEILGQWSKAYRKIRKADMLADAVLQSVAEAKFRFPDAVINPLDVIDKDEY